MAIEKVRAYFFKHWGLKKEFWSSMFPAQRWSWRAAVGVCGAQICKTLSFKKSRGMYSDSDGGETVKWITGNLRTVSGLKQRCFRRKKSNFIQAHGRRRLCVRH